MEYDFLIREQKNPCQNFAVPQTCSQRNSWTNDNARNDRGDCFNSFALMHQQKALELHQFLVDGPNKLKSFFSFFA